MTEEPWLIRLAQALTYINGNFFFCLFVCLPSAPYSISFDMFVYGDCYVPRLYQEPLGTCTTQRYSCGFMFPNESTVENFPFTLMVIETSLRST